LSQANRVLVEELFRHGLGVVLLIGIGAAIYFASRRFVGEAGKTRTRQSTIFAAVGITILALLLLVRPWIEAYLANLVSPLNGLTTTQANWPELAAVGIFRTVIATLALVLIIQAIGRVYWYAEERLLRRSAIGRGPRMHFVVLLAALLRLFRFLSILIVVLLFLPTVLNFFPRTRIIVDRIGGYIGTPAQDIGRAVLGYLPNLAYVIVISILGYYSLKAIKYLFTSLDNGSLVIRDFPAEWANPTYRLVRTLFLLFLLMVTFPYLPGAKSQFFQGFSVFVGALITFGSTATIGNIVSGTVLTYTRAFKLGDMVTIGDRTGVVVAKNLLVTRLVTPKNEEISIPNGNVLATSVLNYSARAGDGLVLTVAAGIGYDVDWRKVHQLMIAGARATERILVNPAPQVFQSALGDYAVNYELRAFTDQPIAMFQTLSTLRANVLDEFNRAGVEIMTPSILAHRDASQLAVPLEQFRDRATPSGIAIDVRTNGSASSSA
jgi:small-conductance mechanosensitive channel